MLAVLRLVKAPDIQDLDHHGMHEPDTHVLKATYPVVYPVKLNMMDEDSMFGPSRP